MKQLTQPQINIAVIDDSQAFQLFIKKTLEENNYLKVPLQCQKGLQFFQEYKRFNIDAVILDIDTPDGDGLYVIEKLAKEYPHIPVIVFSVLDSIRFSTILYSLGVKMCLVKTHIHKLETGILELFNTTSIIAVDRNDLNKDDHQLLQLICDELTIDQIAQKLNIGNEAIKKRKAKLAEKMQIENRDAKFLKWALREGYYFL